jgi:predicted O-linked N-acetylglucosamine transferase (SPINDLY family)
MAQLFEQHDKKRFQFIAFSFGPDVQDDMRRRVSAAFSQFIDVREKSDLEIAQLSRQLQIDIAIDRNGLTRHARSGIFAHRAAPVQVNYQGYPGTLGAPYIDYVLADRIVIPEEEQQFYSENVVYLPHSYFSISGDRPIADREFTRAELGLPNTGFVFCCFNSVYKITPDVFDSWMRILRQVDGSVLWLLHDTKRGADNLRKEALARGVSGERLIFARRMPSAEHLARHRAAGLFLDTLPYNAHTTACDALWAGLPIVTRPGRSFAARVAASVLTAIGLPELITTSAAQYESMAVGLATDPARLRQIKEKINANRLTMPLFNSALLARHLEDSFMQMYERSQQNLAPARIDVPINVAIQESHRREMQ